MNGCAGHSEPAADDVSRGAASAPAHPFAELPGRLVPENRGGGAQRDRQDEQHGLDGRDGYQEDEPRHRREDEGEREDEPVFLHARPLALHHRKRPASGILASRFIRPGTQ